MAKCSLLKEGSRLDIEQILDRFLPKVEGHFKRVNEAMRYSATQGGKRIRPTLMHLSYKAVGGTDDISAYLCAIELIHTYSLIHDDLPAMDNDDLRRGKPTNHVQFDEATAILAGDGLLNLAYEIMLEDILSSMDLPKVRAASILASASGTMGMVGGQILDIQDAGKDIETLDVIHLHKTGALIKAATKMGAVLGYGSAVEEAALEAFGQYIGKVFQIVDDVLDVTSSVDELGKGVNSDVNKMTYVDFYSVDKCYEIAHDLTDRAIRCLGKVAGDTTELECIATKLVKRKF
ncbi:MAG: geranyl transferase [Epulopiscium sp. Nele67-Bin001]|nr:MAG: geranyl transferase [Epulopiscium sp. Nuni2H_MBin001]OON92724.1 MAG: geranyl transferase [Epulopiscium sp. Nele67-Bin001]